MAIRGPVRDSANRLEASAAASMENDRSIHGINNALAPDIYLIILGVEELRPGSRSFWSHTFSRCDDHSSTDHHAAASAKVCFKIS